MTPLVTAVCLTMTPARSHMLPDALRSFRQQTYTPREMVLVNDGEPLVSRAPDVRVVNLPDRGWPWTEGEKRNVGVRVAQGDFLASWDDDDVFLPQRLMESVDALLRWGADAVVADAAWIADEGLRIIGNCRRGFAWAINASILVRRDVVVEAGGYQPVRYGTDIEMLERLRYMVRARITKMPGAWYIMRVHGAQVTREVGETGDKWIQCAARDPDVLEAQAALDALRAGPGGEDVVRA